jgi:hypothetical protein
MNNFTTEATSVIYGRVALEDQALQKRRSRQCVKVSFRALGNLCLDSVENCSYGVHDEENSKETLAVVPVDIAIDTKTEA